MMWLYFFSDVIFRYRILINFYTCDRSLHYLYLSHSVAVVSIFIHKIIVQAKKQLFIFVVSVCLGVYPSPPLFATNNRGCCHINPPCYVVLPIILLLLSLPPPPPPPPWNTMPLEVPSACLFRSHRNGRLCCLPVFTPSLPSPLYNNTCHI